RDRGRCSTRRAWRRWCRRSSTSWPGAWRAARACPESFQQTCRWLAAQVMQAEPLVRGGPYRLGGEAGAGGQSLKVRHAVLAGNLAAQGFTLGELDHPILDPHLLRPVALQVHLDTSQRLIEERQMVETRRFEVAVQLATNALQQ